MGASAPTAKGGRSAFRAIVYPGGRRAGASMARASMVAPKRGSLNALQIGSEIGSLKAPKRGSLNALQIGSEIGSLLVIGSEISSLKALHL